MVTGPVSRPSLPAEGSPGANSSPESSPDPTATAGQPGAGLWMRPFSRPGGHSCPQQEVQGHDPPNVPSRTGDHGLAAPVGTASGGDPRSADRRQAPPRRVQEGRRDVVVVRDRQRLRLRVVDGAHRKAVARARKALDTKICLVGHQAVDEAVTEPVRPVVQPGPAAEPMFCSDRRVLAVQRKTDTPRNRDGKGDGPDQQTASRIPIPDHVAVSRHPPQQVLLLRRLFHSVHVRFQAPYGNGLLHRGKGFRSGRPLIHDEQVDVAGHRGAAGGVGAKQDHPYRRQRVPELGQGLPNRRKNVFTRPCRPRDRRRT